MGSKRAKMTKHDKNGQKGFTLVEVMVALGILAFGILAVASMQTASLTGTGRAQSVTEGTTIAMDKVEQIMALAYGDSNLSNGPHGPESDPSGRYTITWDVSEGIPVKRTKTVTVTVSWGESGGAVKSSALTYIKMDVI